MKKTEQRAKGYLTCPVCNDLMKMGELEGKIMAFCQRKKCESILVFGDKPQKAWQKIRMPYPVTLENGATDED